ncbi:MAG: hypothetical protein GWP35_03675 [Proteobacteria bacterium]|nr:hypothetical protein [Pseudomonadota bacterium]
MSNEAEKPVEFPELKSTPEGIELSVRAIPGASRNSTGEIRQGAMVVKVTTAPEKGKANHTICEVLSGTLGIPKSRIRLLRGEQSRRKTFLLMKITSNEVEEALRSHLE